MRTIDEIWKELQQHPDYVTGTYWSKQNIAETLQDNLDDEDFNRISELFVEENKEIIGLVIDSFEERNYEYGSWVNDMEDLIEKGTKKIFAYDSEIA
jgi:hypothetical protein